MMRTSHPLPLLAALLIPLSTAGAALSGWQTAVTAGTAPAATLFTEVAAPTLTNVGSLSGDRAFEFIVNADPSAPGTDSSALLGTQSVANGRQGLKYEQWQNTGSFGMTAFGVADYESTILSPVSIDTHVVFTSNGTTTDLYVDGVLRTSFAAGLALTGEQGIGAAWNPDTSAYFDVLPGKILGFASYDSSLTGIEILAHYDAFAAVPEPGGATLGLGAVAAFALRRRRH